MPTIEDRVSTVEDLLPQLVQAQLRTQRNLDQLADEMRAFKDEMRADRIRMNKQWGELANKMGTLVEDIVAPNIRRLAVETLGCKDLEFFGVRVMRRHAQDFGWRQEFDCVAYGNGILVINETKSHPEPAAVRSFAELLQNAPQFFPEYATAKIKGVFASLYLSEDVVKLLTRQKIYALAMADETMEILNLAELGV